MTISFLLRPARLDELADLSAMCLRSKAHWGYDDAFMAACVPALTLTAADVDPGLLVVADADGRPAGLGQLGGQPGAMEIDRLFVDPPFIGTGCGRILFEWCVSTAQARGETRLEIEADPDAVPFYQKMGAVRIGEAPSQAIPGRMLPLLELDISGTG